MKKLGEKEWAALTERERQRRIMQIKKKEKKLRREGKHDELAHLFHSLVCSTVQQAQFKKTISCLDTLPMFSLFTLYLKVYIVYCS